MKNTILYLTFAATFTLTTSLQSLKETTSKQIMAEKVISNKDDKPEFVDESLEKYAKYDTKTKLYAEFGAENIKDGTWTPENASTHKSSELTDPRNGKVYNYVWDTDGKSLFMIEAYYRVLKNDVKEKQRQIVDFKDGIYTGMPISEMEEWNGAPFSFVGLNKAEGGTVLFKSPSKKRIIVKVGLDKSLKKRAPRAIRKGKEVLSSSPSVQDYPLFVDYIALKVK